MAKVARWQGGRVGGGRGGEGEGRRGGKGARVGAHVIDSLELNGRPPVGFASCFFLLMFSPGNQSTRSHCSLPPLHCWRRKVLPWRSAACCARQAVRAQSVGDTRVGLCSLASAANADSASLRGAKKRLAPPSAPWEMAAAAAAAGGQAGGRRAAGGGPRRRVPLTRWVTVWPPSLVAAAFRLLAWHGSPSRASPRCPA